MIALVEELKLDIVVTDIGMPNLNGTDATQQITSKFPTYVLRALRVGAWSPQFVPSNSGKAFWSPSVSALLVEDYVRQMQDKSIEDSYDLLSPREKEILQLVAEGKATKMSPTC